jgi:hypothetical protein
MGLDSRRSNLVTRLKISGRQGVVWRERVSLLRLRRKGPAVTAACGAALVPFPFVGRGRL